jgi:hypothetical protein
MAQTNPAPFRVLDVSVQCPVDGAYMLNYIRADEDEQPLDHIDMRCSRCDRRYNLTLHLHPVPPRTTTKEGGDGGT